MGQKPYRVNLKLDPVLDADMIDWLESLPRGTRSRAIRERLRQNALSKSIDASEIRHLLAEELARALDGKQIDAPSSNSSEPDNGIDMEATFGSRLDRMLGGLSAGLDGEMPD